MMKSMLILGLGLAASAGTLGSHRAEAADALRLQCSAEGLGDISMSARYRERASGRRKFSAEFEAAPGGAFSAGQRMAVFVAGVKVGSDRLGIVAGDVQGELELADNVEPGDTEKPFPADFPKVQRDTKVDIAVAGDKVLSCRLQ